MLAQKIGMMYSLQDKEFIGRKILNQDRALRFAKKRLSRSWRNETRRKTSNALLQCIRCTEAFWGRKNGYREGHSSNVATSSPESDVDGVLTPVAKGNGGIPSGSFARESRTVRGRRAGFCSLDAVNVEEVFRRRACVMKTAPSFLRGPFRAVLRIALRQIEREKGLTLFLMAP